VPAARRVTGGLLDPHAIVTKNQTEEVTHMDATRNRRTRDEARRRWYAACRCRRLARFLGFQPARTDRDKK
jgi:hypothetical protein